MITGKVIGKEIDTNGNIKVNTEYVLTDGSKKIGSTRYNYLNFSQAAVEKDIKTHCETLMKRVWGLKKHQELILTDLTHTKCAVSEVEIITKPAIRDVNGNIVSPAELTMIDDK